MDEINLKENLTNYFGPTFLGSTRNYDFGEAFIEFGNNFNTRCCVC